MHKIKTIDLLRKSFLFLVLLNASACATKEEVVAPTPDPTVLELSIETGSQLNPDIEGRSSPLVVRIYAFEAIDKFNTSDFFAIYDNDEALLGKDILFRKEIELQPEATQEMTLTAKPEAHYLAVFAAFRNLDTAQWKASMPIPLNRTTKVAIRFDHYTVTLNAENNH